MTLSGTFGTMPFPDLLQWLGEARRSGVLTVALEFEERHLRLELGEVTALGSDDPRLTDLGRLLLGRGLIDEERLRRVLAAQPGVGQLRETLLDGGHVNKAALLAAVRAHVKDVVLQLFLWEEARFVFSDGGAHGPLGEVFPIELGLMVDPPVAVRELLMDGMRRLDEWQRIADVLPSDFTVVFALGRASDLPALEALADAAEPLALGDFCLRQNRPRFDVLTELYEAHRRGLIAIESRPHDIGAGETAVGGPVAMLVETARVLVAEQQFDEASSLLRSACDLDPYHAEARALLRRARAEQQASLYTELPPYAVPALCRAREEFHGLALLPREQYLLSRIDGHRDVGALALMTPVGELETLRALKKFLRIGLIALRSNP